MKKNFLSVILLLAIVIGACARQKKTVTINTTSSTSASTAGKTSVSYVKMYRTSCFGRCPNYQVEVFENGLARYTGFHFVKDSGVYEKNIGAERAQAILDEFEQKRVDTLKDIYDLLISDISGINYEFTINGKKKAVQNAHFGPAFTKGLARKVDELVKRGDELYLDEQWKRTGDAKRD